MSEEVYTLGAWRAKPGEESEFVAAWQALGRHFGALPHPPGKGTFSATPLAWTHAQFIRLAWSVQAAYPVEQPAAVACRYAGICR